jgi:hypothetical protein
MTQSLQDLCTHIYVKFHLWLWLLLSWFSWFYNLVYVMHFSRMCTRHDLIIYSQYKIRYAPATQIRFFSHISCWFFNLYITMIIGHAPEKSKLQIEWLKKKKKKHCTLHIYARNDENASMYTLLITQKLRYPDAR